MRERISELIVKSLKVTGPMSFGNQSVDGAQVPTGATIEVGAEDSNNVDIVVTLLNAADQPISNETTVQWYISDDSGGSGVAGTAPDTVAIVPSTGVGELHQTVTGKAGFLTTDENGVCDIRVTENGSDTWYLVVILPTGQRVVSAAITTAA